MATPRTWTWDERVRRYRSTKTGRYESWETIRRQVEHAGRNARSEARQLSEDLRAGKISLRTWQDGMRGIVQEVHRAAAVIAKGGHGQMRPADWERVSAGIQEHLSYLNKFAIQIEEGLKLGSGFLRRAEMYAGRMHNLLISAEHGEWMKRGYDQVRSIRHKRDSCDQCIYQEKLGWQPVQGFVLPGDRECLDNCGCWAEWRKSATGQTSSQLTP